MMDIAGGVIVGVLGLFAAAIGLLLVFIIIVQLFGLISDAWHVSPEDFKDKKVK